MAIRVPTHGLVPPIVFRQVTGLLRRKKPKTFLRILESGFLKTGAILLATFVLIHGWGDYQGWSDIRAFEAAMASESEPGEQPAGGTKYAPEPDYALWSSKRITDYHEGNAERDDPPLAIMSIDKLDLKVPVYNGTDEINLNRGAGRIKGTAWIDSPGNLGIAGHRDGFFRVLKDIEMGDSINMLTHQGKSEFVVSSITIVDPTDVSVLAPTDKSTITLVTCYPFYFVGHAPKRYIVKGELLSRQVTKS
jgi:sortase A